MLQSNNTPAPVYARANTLRTTPEELAGQFQKEGVAFAVRNFDWSPPGWIFELRSHPPLSSLSSFRRGWFYVQDPSTLLAVTELQASAGETILDLCAAPGGKTTFLA